MKQYGMRIVLYCVLVFALGFVAFIQGAFRFGWHPNEWRVTGATKSLDHVVSGCFSGNDGERTQFMLCAQKKLVANTKRWGTYALMNALEQKLGAQRNDRKFTQCHDLAHAIGWSGTVVAKNVQTILPKCTNTCVSGCQHGAVSAWYGLGNNLADFLPTLCIKDIDWSQNPKAQGGCFHEVGHAIADVASYDLEASLKWCDRIIPQGRVDCAAGVFMEMFEAATFAQKPRSVPANHPDWCSALWPPYEQYCFIQAGSYEYAKLQNETDAFGVCTRVPLPFQSECIQNLGQNIFYVYQHRENYHHAVLDFCKRAPGKLETSCIRGLVNSSVFVEPDVKTAILLCNLVSHEMQASCYSSLGEALFTKRTKTDATRVCERMPMAFVSVCMRGEGVGL